MYLVDCLMRRVCARNLSIHDGSHLRSREEPGAEQVVCSQPPGSIFSRPSGFRRRCHILKNVYSARRPALIGEFGMFCAVISDGDDPSLGNC